MTKLLVTGATGQLGKRVLHHLLDTLHVAPQDIIATTRRPQALVALSERGVEVRAADFDDPASLSGAFHGAQRMLLISTDPIDRPGRRQEQHTKAIAAAEKAGVKHLIYTSMPQPELSPLLIAGDHEGTERALALSDLKGWTVLRNHWYFENLYFTLPAVRAQGGQWYSAAGEGRLANISRDDLARAAAMVLASADGGRSTYTLSGSEALSTEEQAAILSQELRTSITVNQVPLEDLVQGMCKAGVPESVARVLASFDTNTAAGRVADVTSDYRLITGRDPQRFVDWVRAHRGLLADG
ncbi:SDR family oxidoreductase [Hydrogenophaga pseudoflava]|uniref:Quinone oxidoreductase 2 n=1 Tax=Hydrogenophaga pseudoflava TaxID=47421 RepID=A0A4V1ABU6_HYDPS|nr:SDR family oxidoreductase [Hydrogenophaga pseudoflava]QBM29193.1 Quinone oxidoreductase 2 [Hydrogenophaga pseudoflava]